MQMEEASGKIKNFMEHSNKQEIKYRQEIIWSRMIQSSLIWGNNVKIK